MFALRLGLWEGFLKKVRGGGTLGVLDFRGCFVVFRRIFATFACFGAGFLGFEGCLGGGCLARGETG